MPWLTFRLVKTFIFLRLFFITCLIYYSLSWYNSVNLEYICDHLVFIFLFILQQSTHVLCVTLIKPLKRLICEQAFKVFTMHFEHFGN